MILYNIIFYFFSGIAILSALMVISAKNPVHSVLFLILSFINAAALFILLGAEFLAMILIVVYVGAVAVLFLFVVMMLDINYIKLREGFLQYLPIASFIGIILITELIIVFLSKNVLDSGLAEYSSTPSFNKIGNTQAIGKVLYTEYFYLFQICGIILLVAMIGSILLTLRQRDGVKKQNILKQISSTKSRIKKKNIPLGKGISK